VGFLTTMEFCSESAENWPLVGVEKSLSGLRTTLTALQFEQLGLGSD
jgi:hypothetical protein